MADSTFFDDGARPRHRFERFGLVRRDWLDWLVPRRTRGITRSFYAALRSVAKAHSKALGTIGSRHDPIVIRFAGSAERTKQMLVPAAGNGLPASRDRTLQI